MSESCTGTLAIHLSWIMIDVKGITGDDVRASHPSQSNSEILNSMRASE